MEAHALKQLVLDRVVDTLGHGVVLGVPASGHAYAYVALPEAGRIGVTGVLDAAVRVMDQAVQALVSVMRQGHLQRLQGITGLQRITHAITYDLPRVVIRHQGEITEIALARFRTRPVWYIGNIADYQLAGTIRDPGPHQVRINRVTMAGVRCPDTPFPFAYLQAIAFHDVIETVIAHAMGAKTALVHLPELVPTYARIPSSNSLDELDDERLLRQATSHLILMLVVGLLAHTK